MGALNGIMEVSKRASKQVGSSDVRSTRFRSQDPSGGSAVRTTPSRVFKSSRFRTSLPCLRKPSEIESGILTIEVVSKADTITDWREGVF